MEHGSLMGFRRGRTVLGRHFYGPSLALAVGLLSAAALAQPPALQRTMAADLAKAQQTASTRLSHAQIISYPFEQVWPTAIRYLRVDRGFAVVDQNAEAGYLLFEFDLGDARRGHGSLEAFRTEDSSGRPSVRIQVSTSQGPVHLPHAIVDGLAAKLLAERGQPPPPPPPKPPGEAPAPDPAPPSKEGADRGPS